MKLPLATGMLSAALGTSEPKVLRVSEVLDRGFAASAPEDEDALPPSYRVSRPVDRWRVMLRGSSVVLTEVGGRNMRLEGREEASRDGTRRFAFGDGALGRTGRFVLHPDDTAEVIIFGSGVNVAVSERGRLVAP